ncbi:MAG: ZIP family metal transporter [Rhodoferax sp.]|nr:ZIP family metal transporter [Rhodoferax sp.]
MLLIAILTGTLLAGIGSVWVAALLSFGVLARYTQHMLSLAAGALLATAFMHLLPEAFESQAGASDLFMVFLMGLVFFFLLDKAELWHHGHEHHHDHPAEALPASGQTHGHTHEVRHAHRHGHDHGHAQPPDHGHDHAPGRVAGSWSVLAGDSVHCFGDGMLIASAFMADLRLGVIAALAVAAHEVPHHMGDLMVLRAGSGNRRAALIKVSLAGALTALGGLCGYWLVDRLQDYLPYFLVVASSSFSYVALADLIPQLQKHLSTRQTAAQVAWLFVGILLVTLVGGLAHGH